MRKNIKTLLTVMLIVMVSYKSVNSCTVSRVLTGKEICSRAEYIVRVLAKESVQIKNPYINPVNESTNDEDSEVIKVYVDTSLTEKVRFEIIEIIKGNEFPRVIDIEGKLTNRDDFSDMPVPRDAVRSEGRGVCYAGSYKENAEFLLFLVYGKGGYTPYWAPLAATNEQLTSGFDPWLLWVKSEVSKKDKLSFKNFTFSSDNYFQVFLKDFSSTNSQILLSFKTHRTNVAADSGLSLRNSPSPLNFGFGALLK